jgi:hypothetical protein
MQLEDVSLFGRRLFWNARKGEVESAGSIQLPFGAINKVGNLRFDLDGRDSEIRSLVVSRPPNGDHVILYPIPTFVRELSTAGFGRFKVNVFVITAHHERSQALQVIERCHYLEPPLRGMIVACKFIDQNTQREIRKKARATDFIDPWSEAWHDKPGGIVGCAVLDTLYHGNPLGRREIPEISKTDLRSLLRTVGAEELIWSQISRVKLLERFRISWASRFAVDAPYRGLGLSTLMAELLLVIAQRNRYPPAKYVEVVTTVKKEDLSERGGPKDFLIRAGYTLTSQTRPSDPIYSYDAETGSRLTRSTAKKLYYYAKT